MALALDDFRGGARGHVRIAANTSAINGGFLPALLADFRARNPRVGIEVEELSSGEVVDTVIALSRSTSVRRRVSAAAEAHGGTLRVPIQVASFDAMCRMVAAGLGLGVLPRSAALPHAGSMRLALLDLDEAWAARRET